MPFASYMGLSYFLACFVLGWALVSLQLKQADHAFPNTENLPLIRLFLRQSRKSRKTVFCSCRFERRSVEDTLLYDFSKKTFLFYFPKDSAAYSLKRGDRLLVYARLSPPVNNGNPDEFDYARYLLRKGNLRNRLCTCRTLAQNWL